MLGHISSKSNIAVSASNDSSCIVWDYANGEALHTFLLTSSPLCLALDPADRAVYIGYEDGSVQIIDFYSQGSLIQPLHNPVVQATPTQPSPSDRWSAPEHSDSPVLCLQVSYDGTSVVSGHKDGKIHSWDVAAGKYGSQLAEFSVPITNLLLLKPNGFPSTLNSAIKLHNVVKPRYESFVNPGNNNHGISGAVIPMNYTFTAQFSSNLPLPRRLADNAYFQEALAHPSFPPFLLEETLADFTSTHKLSSDITGFPEIAEIRAQNALLSSQLSTAKELQRSATASLHERDKEDWRRQKDEEIKAARKKRRRLRMRKTAELARKKEMGELAEEGDEEMGETEEEDLSSSTDEITESD